MKSGIALAAACLCTAGLANAGPLHVENGNFVDASGNVVVLRGIALSQHGKIPPFTPAADPAIYTRLHALGYNMIRDQFNWEAFEPSPGQYNASYLAYYQTTVANAAAAGLYVVVDVHQDLWSRNTFGGCGEGMPLWSLPPYVTAVTPRNDSSCASWGLTALFNGSTLDQMFNDFFDDRYGLRTRYLAMLDRLVPALKSYGNVIGYEPINEPWGYAANLQAFHQMAVNEVRKFDPSAIAFIEPVVDFNVLDGGGMQTQANKSPFLGPAPTYGNVAFAPHYYNPYVIETNIWLGDSSSGKIAAMQQLARQWGAALWLGEFGASNKGNMLGYLDDIYAQLDAGGISSSTWAWTPEWNATSFDGWNNEDFSVVRGDGSLQPNTRIRPHVNVAGGTGTSLVVRYPGFFSWPVVSYRWNADSTRAPAQLFVPYGAVFGLRTPQIITSGAVNCQLQPAQQALTCTASRSGAATVTLF